MSRSPIHICRGSPAPAEAFIGPRDFACGFRREGRGCRLAFPERTRIPKKVAGNKSPVCGWAAKSWGGGSGGCCGDATGGPPQAGEEKFWRGLGRLRTFFCETQPGSCVNGAMPADADERGRIGTGLDTNLKRRPSWVTKACAGPDPAAFLAQSSNVVLGDRPTGPKDGQWQTTPQGKGRAGSGFTKSRGGRELASREYPTSSHRAGYLRKTTCGRLDPRPRQRSRGS